MILRSDKTYLKKNKTNKNKQVYSYNHFILLYHLLVIFIFNPAVLFESIQNCYKEEKKETGSLMSNICC